MFNLFNKSKPKGETITLKIDGMHCTSCSLNIDGELEDLDGVFESKTSYPKSQTTVTFDPAKITPVKIHATITSLGYKVLSNV